MARITVKKLESLKGSDIGTRLSDEHALYGLVKARESGVAVLFRWRYRFDGKLRDFNCGTWPTVSLADIRQNQEAARQILAQGQDPNTAKRISRLSEVAAQAEALAAEQTRLDSLATSAARITVSDLFNRWEEVELIRHKDKGKEIRRMFEKDVLPKIGALAVEDVRKGHVTGVTDALLARGVTRMAKMIFSLVRQMFRFAVDRDIIENDPTASIRKAKIGGKDTERERVLSEVEIKSLFTQIPNAHLMPSTEIAIWLSLATCCRIGELLQARWRDIDWQAKEWRIPPESSKNGKAHTVYLSDFALKKFQALYAVNGTIEDEEGKTHPAEWCYPDRSGTDAVCVKTVTKQIGDRQRGDKKVMSRRSPYKDALKLAGGRWTPHDLRRTGATLMTALGVLPEVAERCLNHTEENKVKRIYQRHSYENEKREAWRLLGERIELLIRPDADNVIPLPRSA